MIAPPSQWQIGKILEIVREMRERQIAGNPR